MKDNLKVVVMNVRKKDDPFCFGSSFFHFSLFPAQLICLCNCRDDVRENVLFSKFLYKAYFCKVFLDVVVYAAEDKLNAVFL